MDNKLTKVLINNNWSEMPMSSLQVGSNQFGFKTGLYETLRTFDSHPVFLEPHLDRLYSTAARIQLSISYSKTEIFHMIEKVIDSFSDPQQRVRILAVPEKIIVYTSHLNLNPIIYNGVKALTVQTQRNNPELKTTDYHACLTAWTKANNQGCFEAILIDETNYLYEGTRSNVFWIKDNKLFTRHHDVLPGTTRQTISQKSPYPIMDGKLNLKYISKIDELFLTNSGSGIVPVTLLNGKLIGSGSVGIITQQLLSLYHNWMIQDIERKQTYE